MVKRDVDRVATRYGLASTRAAAKSLVAAVVCAAVMLPLGAPAGATERNATTPQPQTERLTGPAQPAPSELAREGLAKMLQALDAAIQSVPQYHMPEIAGNGDIIIRRKQPQPTPGPTPAPPQRQGPPTGKGPGAPI